MNDLLGIIKEVHQYEGLALVEIQVGSTLMKSITIASQETASFLIPARPIQVLFKETEVSIAKKSATFVSLQNQLPCRIVGIEKGQLLSRLKLHHEAGPITAVITTAAVNLLQLQEEDVVFALIKTNELLLAPEKKK